MTDVLSPGSRRAHIRKTQTHYVYELWGDKHCLYVGVTSNLGQRLSTHARKDWWHLVQHVVANAHADRRYGLIAEKDRIEQFDPIYNIQGAL